MKKSEWNEGLNHIDNDLVANYIAQKEILKKLTKFFPSRQVCLQFVVVYVHRKHSAKVNVCVQ